MSLKHRQAITGNKKCQKERVHITTYLINFHKYLGMS